MSNTMRFDVNRLRTQHTGRDEGFTLIELLVVIVIIGVLAAIAIPVLLNQRQKAYETAARSDLRNLAEFQEMYLTSAGEYGTIAEILAAEPTLSASNGVTLTVVRYAGVNGYCLSAQHEGSPTSWFWDSSGGGLQPRGATDCPVTTTGAPGDTLTG